MSNGELLSFGKLLLEDRDDAALAPEDVPKSDGHEGGFGIAIRARQYGHLCNPFRRRHDAVGAYRLIRRDQHELVDTRRARSLRQLPRPDHVVPNRLGGVDLHEGDVLVRRRMVHPIRPVPPKKLLDSRPVQDVANYGNEPEVRIGVPQLELQVVKVALRLVV